MRAYFDPVLPHHARMLARHKQGAERLGVIIAPLEESLLPATARAEIVASLECVDLVRAPGAETPAGTGVIDECESDLRERGRFLQHVLARHGRLRE